MTNNPFAGMQGMMNDPIVKLARVAMGGGNPMQLIQQFLPNDPRTAQAMNIIQGKSLKELQQIGTNMAKENGTTPEAIARSLGIF